MSDSWVPIDKEFRKLLPKDRPYTKLEAAFCLQLDANDNNPVSVSGYANLWDWGIKKVKIFLEKMGVDIIYSSDTKSKQNQRGYLKKIEKNIVNLGTDQGTDQGQIREQISFIDINYLKELGNRSGNRYGNRSGATTNNPLNPNPKKINTTLPKKDLARGVDHSKISSNSEVKTFITFASESYLEKFKNLLMVDEGKDGANIKKLLGTYSLEKLKELWLKFLDVDDDFINQRGRSIPIFKCSVNRLISGKLKKTSDTCYHDEGRSIPPTHEQLQIEEKERKLKFEYEEYCKRETRNRIESLSTEQREREIEEYKKEFLKKYPMAKTWDDEVLRESLGSAYELEILNQFVTFEEWKQLIGK